MKASSSCLYKVYKTYKKKGQQFRLVNLFFSVNLFNEIKFSKVVKNKQGKDINIDTCYEARNKKDCTEKTAFFLDFDLKDKNGNAYTNKAVKNMQKTKLYQQFSKFPIFPSAINESCNGFHCFWIIDLKDRQIENAEWEHIEQKIYDFAYNSISKAVDSNAKDITRILRVPESIHWKPNSEPFEITVRHISDTRYSITELRQAFNVSDTTTETHTIQPPKARHINHTDKECHNEIVQRVKNKDIHLEHITQSNTTKTFTQAINYFKQFPINEFFKVNASSCLSLIRKESNPSGSIYLKDNTYLFHDFGLNQTYDLINLVAHIQESTAKDSITYLANVFGITITKNTEFDFTQFKADSLNVFDNLAQQYKPLKSARIVYSTILDTLKERSTEKRFISNPLKCNVMLASRFIADKLGKPKHDRIARKLLVFEYLGMIQRVNVKTNPNKIDMEWKAVANKQATFYRINDISKIDYNLLKHKCLLLQNETKNIWKTLNKTRLQKIEQGELQ